MAKKPADTHLASRIVEIYADLDVSLRGIARKLNTPHPKQSVDEWFSRAYEIALKFDRKELTAKVRLEESEELSNYDTSRHTTEQLEHDFKRYLRQAFSNDLHRAYALGKRIVSESDIAAAGMYIEKMAARAPAAQPLPIFRYDVIKLSQLVRLLEDDLSRLSQDRRSMPDAIYHAFIQAFLNYCRGLLQLPEWQEVAVIPDPDETDSKLYFNPDFRVELENNVRRELCRIIISEKNPILVHRLHVLADSSGPAALRKRLFRYLFEYRGGIPDRIRNRIKNRTL